MTASPFRAGVVAIRLLWDLLQLAYLRMEGFYLRWRLRRQGIDADSLPEIQELRRRYQAG